MSRVSVSDNVEVIKERERRGRTAAKPPGPGGGGGRGLWAEAGGRFPWGGCRGEVCIAAQAASHSIRPCDQITKTISNTVKKHASALRDRVGTNSDVDLFFFSCEKTLLYLQYCGIVVMACMKIFGFKISKCALLCVCEMKFAKLETIGRDLLCF